MSAEEPAVAVDAYVTRLLDRAGLQPRQRVTYVAETLGIGYHLARRRMIGETPWTVDEMAKLATSCKETLQSLFSDETGQEADLLGQPAELALGMVRIACRVWVGVKVTARQTSSLVALQPTKGLWLVVPAAEAQGADSYEVERVVIKPERTERPRIAVLDDDDVISHGIAEYMNEKGFEAHAFVSLDELSLVAESEPFDGYVLDWLIDKQNTRALIASIRVKDQTCPIVLLTGQLKKGKADESEVASVASLYRLTYFEKPIRSSSIMSALQLGFELRAGA